MFKKAFTLIELLVVIAIIGILISIVSVNFITAQKQARDSRRKQDIASIQTALEQYYSINGAYPDSGSVADAFESGQAPVDPKDESPYQYIWNVNTASYCICSVLEKQTGNATGATGTSCNWDNTSNADNLCVQNQQ